MYTDKDLGIRPIKDEDLLKLWELVYKDEKSGKNGQLKKQEQNFNLILSCFYYLKFI